MLWESTVWEEIEEINEIEGEVEQVTSVKSAESEDFFEDEVVRTPLL